MSRLKTCRDIYLKWCRDKKYVVAASLLSRLMLCCDFDPYVMLPSVDVVTLTAIADV